MNRKVYFFFGHPKLSTHIYAHTHVAGEGNDIAKTC